jgi:hypothetical protein
MNAALPPRDPPRPPSAHLPAAPAPRAARSLLRRWFERRAERWNYPPWRRRFVELGSSEARWFRATSGGLERLTLSVVVLMRAWTRPRSGRSSAGWRLQRFTESRSASPPPAGVGRAEVQALLGDLALRHRVDVSGSRLSLLRGPAALEACSGEYAADRLHCPAPHAAARASPPCSPARRRRPPLFDEEARAPGGLTRS